MTTSRRRKRLGASRSRRVTSVRKKRLIRTLLGLLVLLVGLAYYGLEVSEPPWFDLTGDEEAPLPSASDEPAPSASDEPAWEEAIDATAEAGVAEVDVTVRAVMPEEMSDGVPRRRFSGEGSLDLEMRLASVEYGMRKIPNSAGYFGHVPGKVDTVYSGPGFAATFPLMARALPGDEEWLFYDLDVLSNARAIQLGIGQLREIALSDPRLAFGMLRGVVDDVETSDGGQAITVDLDRAIDEAVDDGVREMMTTMRDLVRVSIEEAEVTLDDDGRVEQIAYTLTYPTAWDDIELSVDLDVTGFGGLRPEPPDEDLVLDYAEHLEL